VAITWDVEITPLNVARKEASVTAVRTDSDNPTIVETHHIITCVLDTTAQKSAVLDQLWNMHLAWVANQAAIAAYIGGLEESAKTNLEARE
jgi:hypothetical protein